MLEVADFVVDVGAGGGGVEDLEMGRVEPEQVDDVCADARRGCCCEGADRDRGVLQRPLEPREFFVGGAEIVAPFADAVRFVDGDAG